ncbi:MAG: hypothetical protein ACT4QA_23380 [Panacagrimonas sp.]
MTNAPEFERLANRMGRPPSALRAFERLTPDQLLFLHDAVDAACARQHRSLDEALSGALPGPLRWLVLRLLRGRKA